MNAVDVLQTGYIPDVKSSGNEASEHVNCIGRFEGSGFRLSWQRIESRDTRDYPVSIIGQEVTVRLCKKEIPIIGTANMES